MKKGVVIIMMYCLTKKLYAPLIALALIFSLTGRADPARDEAVFNRVMENLDAGGVFLFVFNGEDFTRVLPEKLDELWNIIKKAVPEEEKKEDGFATAQGIYRLIHSMLSDSGIPALNAVGMSSKRMNDEIYRNRIVLDRKDIENPGILWRLGGSENRPLETFKMFPEDTVLASRGVFNMSKLFSWIQNEINKSELPQARQALADWLMTTRQMGVDLEKIFASTTGEIGFLVTMDRERRHLIPETASKMEIPHLEVAIYLGCHNDELFNVINTFLQMDSVKVSSVDEEDKKLRTVNLPQTGELPFAPTIARFGDYLVIASTKELAERIIAVNKEEEPTVFTASSEFQRLHAGLPAEGTAFSYISEEFMEEYEEFILQLFTQKAEEDPFQSAFREAMNLFNTKESSASVSVTTVNRHGSVTESHSTDSLRQLVVIPAVAGTGIMAGVALPAFYQARSNAQKNACINNLRMLDAAKQQWAIEEGIELDAQPGFEDIEVYLPPNIVCPQGGAYQLNSVGESPSCSVHGPF